MRPIGIVLALTVLGGLLWSFLRNEPSEAAPELPSLAAPSDIRVEREEGRLAEVARDDVARREAESTAPDSTGPAATALDSDGEARQPLVDPALAGLLEVQVVEFETGRPIAGANVSLYPKDADEGPHVQWLGGDPTQPPKTDDAGIARFHLSPDVAFQLWGNVSGGEGSHAGESVEPLRTGERRMITLRLRTSPDLKIVGRVIDASTRGGVAEAHVRFCNVTMAFGDGDGGGQESRVQTAAELVTDADGWFEGEASSWRYLHGRVTATGYGPAFFSLQHGHESREDALVVEVSPGAILRGRVLDAPDSSALVVRASAEGHALMARQEGVMMYAGEMVRKVGVEPDGRWELADLPAAVALKLELFEGTEVVRREPQRLSLAPGETRELEWRLGSGVAVLGRISIADDGGPLADHPVWLAPASEVAGPFRFGNAPTASRTTDEQGRFAFDDVAPGEWRVGPAPVRNEWESPKPDEVVAMSQLVTVPEGVASVEVEVTAHRGLFIHGEILAPDGTRLRKDGWVWGQSSENRMWANGEAKGGRFALGPLVPGTYEVTGSGGGFAASLPVEARAGDRDVVLRLRLGGSIHGRLVDAESGDPMAGEVLFVREDSSDGGTTMTIAQPDGRFELVGVLPGTFRIQGSAGALVGEVRGISVAPEQEVRDVEVPLRTGIALEVSYTGVSPSGWYRVESEGVPLTFKTALPGQVTTTRHPAGSYTVRLTLPGGEDGENRELVREVTLVPGETAVVEFDDEGE